MAVVSASHRAAVFGLPGRVDRVVVQTPWGVTTQAHKLIAPLFLAACEDAARTGWKPQRIDSYNPRPIRGYDGDRLEEWSLHASCLAWDFFVTPPNVPPPGGVWTPDDGVPPEFAECFERHGFRWGGRWASRRDTPHIEWAGGHPDPVIQDDEELSMADVQAIFDRLNAIELRLIELDDDIPENLSDQLAEIRRNLRKTAAAAGVAPGDIEA